MDGDGDDDRIILRGIPATDLVLALPSGYIVRGNGDGRGQDGHRRRRSARPSMDWAHGVGAGARWLDVGGVALLCDEEGFKGGREGTTDATPAPPGDESIAAQENAWIARVLE